ncbi:MAG TPA: metallophosphoesterase family protein [Kofleriaceae bacterium]|nr:metallophosphoesterase family protein [Kofleriaceae bacterium]
MLARMVVIGDVHTEATRLALVLDHARRAGVDGILCVGDIVDGPEDAARCIELLREHDVITVRGNHERWHLDGTPLEPLDVPDEARAWMAALPTTRRLETVAGSLLLGHGVGEHDMTRLLPDDEGYALDCNFALWELVSDRAYRFAVGGHTHQRMVRRFDDLTFLNPGTLARRDAPGFLDLDLRAGTGTWFQVDLERVAPDGGFVLDRIPRERGPAA